MAPPIRSTIKPDKALMARIIATEADGERVTMMVTYYVADSAKTWLKYRLRRFLLNVGWHPER